VAITVWSVLTSPVSAARLTDAPSAWRLTTTACRPSTFPRHDCGFAYGSELLDQDLAGRYELEPIAGSGPPWLYM
jgi:hypothetical protein